VIPGEARNARLRSESLERQRRSLRNRRFQVEPKDPRIQSVVRRGWAELDRLEARAAPMTRAEVAASLGITREAVRLIELRALAKISTAILELAL
jgi:DNA-directed RNA polymerase sigma subunit (sigma70/sigma32)